MGLGAVGSEAAAALGIGAMAEDLVEEPAGGLPWRSHLPVARLATDSVGLASLAIELAATARDDRSPLAVRVDGPSVAASFTSERLLRIDGRPPAVWAPLSGFWRTADGWVRTHANYPHHEGALRALLRLPPDAGKDAVAAAIAAHSAIALETAAASAGAIVGAVRSPAEWEHHPQGRLLATTPLIEWDRFDGAGPRAWPEPGAGALSGIRVLDLTRVLAGPIAARDLALAGAEVLRIDSPSLPETGWIHLDTGQGKRSALLNLRDRADRTVFEALLAGADVVLTGYRPGALTRFGLKPCELAERHPGLVMAQVAAWGYRGPWAHRRGFDSIVQAVTGIALIESGDGDVPGTLPAQALDHATGHLLAAAIVTGIVEQRHRGGSLSVRMSLARTARALLMSPDVVAEPVEGDPPTREHTLPRPGVASLRYAAPVLAFPGAPTDYADVGGAWGTDAAAWQDAPR